MVMVTKGGGCNLVQHEYEEEDDDYIDMEIGSNLVCGHSSSLSSLPAAADTEFEFQMLSSSSTTAAHLLQLDQTANSSSSTSTSTTHADELFYRGKLLPLHHGLCTRRLQTDRSTNVCEEEEELFSSAIATPWPTTPFESCTVSPSQSCRRLSTTDIINPLMIHSHHHFKTPPAPAVASVDNHHSHFNLLTTPSQQQQQQHNKKSSWTIISKIKQSSILGSKLKAASKAYLNSLLFPKLSPSSQQQHSNLALQRDEPSKPACAGSANKNVGKHRRSLSSIKRHISSSSSSNIKIPLMTTTTSNSCKNTAVVLKRSNTSSLTSESPIQEAIAHCKKSSLSSSPHDHIAFSSSAARISISTEDHLNLLGISRG